MQVSDSAKAKLHAKLPIDKDENVVAVYRHHWFAYAVNWIIGGFVVIVVMAAAIALTSIGGVDSSLAAHKAPVLAGAAAFCAFVLLGTMLPVYLRSQEQLVLTDEALLQMLQPSLFSSKVDSVSLQRIDDVSVRQNFWGTIFGYGHVTVETPGEQDNYEFYILPKPHDAAREISATKENFEAALNAGRLPTTMGQAPIQTPQLDPQQYQQFLQYQQMLAQQQAANPQSAVIPGSGQPAVPPAPAAMPPQPAYGTPPPQPEYPPNAETGQNSGADQAENNQSQ